MDEFCAAPRVLTDCLTGLNGIGRRDVVFLNARSAQRLDWRPRERLFLIK